MNASRNNHNLPRSPFFSVLIHFVSTLNVNDVDIMLREAARVILA